ncbi:hypothetical protein OIU84_018495 [Salix udensis]|uniref:UPF0113 domain-containing protein n=1 Tax=Salix udensis TaxID=889485 RepID=A0AAD6KXY9_9ROSI|nr:hypothetical protein OIU84_018495 [Salix udensis]
MRPLEEKEMGEETTSKTSLKVPSHEGPDPNPGRYCFRLHKNKVFYISESLVRRATNISRKNLGGLGKITDSINQNDGVIVFSMSDVPLGFGTAARSTQDCRKCDPNGIVVHHYSDIGEYLRDEDDL